MNTQNKLSISMAVFFVFVMAFFSYLILQEKGNPLIKIKLEKKLTTYINNHYQEIIDDVEIGKLHYDHSYYINVYNKNNHNLFFKVIYKNKKIASTYKEDYVLGKTLLKKYEKSIESELKSKKYQSIKVHFLDNLNDFDTSTKNKLLNNNSIKSLPIYKIELTKKVKTVNSNSIKKLITDFYYYCNNKKIKPKYYSFVINDNIVLTKVTEDIILYRLDDVINDKLILEEKKKNE